MGDHALVHGVVALMRSVLQRIAPCGLPTVGLVLGRCRLELLIARLVRFGVDLALPEAMVEETLAAQKASLSTSTKMQ